MDVVTILGSCQTTIVTPQKIQDDKLSLSYYSGNFIFGILSSDFLQLQSISQP